MFIWAALSQKADYVENNKAAVDKFLEEYKESVERANSDVSGVAALCETYKIVGSAAVAEKPFRNAR